MKKIFILLASMFLLVGCVESLALIGGGATNGKLVQSSLQTVASYGVKKKTGKSPIQHALRYAEKKNPNKEKKTCSTFTNKKDLEICVMAEERIISYQDKKKEKNIFDKPSKKYASSLRSSIDKKSSTKYLD